MNYDPGTIFIIPKMGDIQSYIIYFVKLWRGWDTCPQGYVYTLGVYEDRNVFMELNK